MRWLVLVLVSILVSGCTQSWSALEEERKPSTFVMYCHTQLFSIHEVDKLLPENCYAIVTNHSNDFRIVEDISKSLNYIGKTKYEIWEEIDGRNCERVIDLNEKQGIDVFCLRNHTQCMVVDNLQICRMVDLE